MLSGSNVSVVLKTVMFYVSDHFRLKCAVTHLSANIKVSRIHECLYIISIIYIFEAKRWTDAESEHHNQTQHNERQQLMKEVTEALNAADEGWTTSCHLNFLKKLCFFFAFSFWNLLLFVLCCRPSLPRIPCRHILHIFEHEIAH